MTAARFVVGDTRSVTASLPDGSVNLLLTSPPFLALRSYLPANHPDKALEIGSEANPAEFIDVLLALTAEWRRVLAPHGSICVELGDTYWHRSGNEDPDRYRSLDAVDSGTVNAGPGWPLAKSLTLIPESYRWALVYGRNPFTGAESPAGRWRVRNVVRWVRPNPPVGALGDKWRPATSDLVCACTSGRRYWDEGATRVAPVTNQASDDFSCRFAERVNNNPAGTPLLDWWHIVPKGYVGSHYAVWPPELCVAPIDAMCPRRVCTTCGKPSERTTEPTPEHAARLGADMFGAHHNDTMRRISGKSRGGGRGNLRITAEYVTIGWTTCGCPGTDGRRLDGFHDGAGWRPGVVLDPFAGTGTTLAVASGMGRDSIGIDLDARNAELAVQRVGPLLLTVEHHREGSGV